MLPSEWACDRIRALAGHHRIVWVDDPYVLVDGEDLGRLEKALQDTNHLLVRATSAFRLRAQLQDRDPQKQRVVLLDQSCTPRDPHLLPLDAKPADLIAIPAPDWKPLVHPQAHLSLNVRDFLAAATDDADWPGEVNIHPYRHLASKHVDAFLRAYDTFRRSGRALTTDDLLLLGFSAVLGTDLFDLSDPLVALEVAFHKTDRWKQAEELFHPSELSRARALMAQVAPRPHGDLFREDTSAPARLALVALLVLRQHREDPGSLLAQLSAALSAYAEFCVPPCSAPPPWFLETEVPLFEKLISAGVRKSLHKALNLDDPQVAQTFARNERLSRTLQDLVPFDASRAATSPAKEEALRLVGLVPRFKDGIARLQDILGEGARRLEALRRTPPKRRSGRDFLSLFVDRDLYRAEQIEGELRAIRRHVEDDCGAQVAQIQGFKERWDQEVRRCTDLLRRAQELRQDLDLLFGRLLEDRYSEIVPAEFWTTDLFYDQFIGPRRRAFNNAPTKAVILVFDSMRFDLWRQLVRPFLETTHEIEEKVGFALLPSETIVSRRAFFAGKPPAQVPPSGSESDLFAACVSRFHGVPVAFVEGGPKRPGFAFYVRTADRVTHTAVFDFTDVLTHKVDWDPATLQGVIRPLLSEVRAFLQAVGEDTHVFVTSDHGHILQEGAPIYLTESEDLGYRSAYVPKRIEDQRAARLFQIPAQTLKHNRPGWYVFPAPGYALRDSKRAGAYRPDASYRHGGISLSEVLVPLAHLRHRDLLPSVRLSATVRGKPTSTSPCVIEVALSVESILASPVTVAADRKDVEPAVVSGVSSTPTTARLTFVPPAPGRYPLRLSATLGDRCVGHADVEVEVAAAVPAVDPAREKLTRMFGEPGS